MWAYSSVFYQIYPLGFCGAPKENDGVLVPRINAVTQWVPHLQQLGVNAVYFSPVFQSDRHGYDTRDYRTLDCRLGTNQDFAQVCAALHEAGIRVVLDGVFNHVGRGFWTFQDLLQNRENSPYKDWFNLNFGGNSPYNDGLWYEGWEGHYELVKLNLKNPQVVKYLLESVRLWVQQFDIDGLRLDVAYCLDHDFLRRLRSFCDGLKPDFLLLGEIISGDYKQIVNPQMLHSCTNYECRKSLYSSFNDLNLFEIAHSLNRQFGRDPYAIYKGEHLLSFADNHDVTRLATILKNQQHLPLVYALLFALPGMPCIYYGSEWGAQGDKAPGSDDGLRPCFDAPQWNPLCQLIAQLARIHAQQPALCHGDYKSLVLTNRQLVLERCFEGQRVYVAINADSEPCFVRFNGADRVAAAQDLFTGQPIQLQDGAQLPAHSFYYWQAT